MVMWEFNQNDAKRDSGSKLVRLGLASALRIRDPFPGLVLSAEAGVVVSDSKVLYLRSLECGIECALPPGLANDCGPCFQARDFRMVQRYGYVV